MMACTGRLGLRSVHLCKTSIHSSLPISSTATWSSRHLTTQVQTHRTHHQNCQCCSHTRTVTCTSSYRQYGTYSPPSPILEEVYSAKTGATVNSMIISTFGYDIHELTERAFNMAMEDKRDVQAITNIVKTIEDDVQFFSATDVAQLSWALARLNLQHPALYKAMGRRLKTLSKDMSPQEVSNTAWGYAANGVYRRDYFYPLSHRAVEKLDEMNLQALGVLVRSFADMKDKDQLLFAKCAKKVRKHIDHLQASDVANIVVAFAFASQSVVGRTIIPALAVHSLTSIENGSHKYTANEMVVLVTSLSRSLTAKQFGPIKHAMVKHAESQYYDFSDDERTMLYKTFTALGAQQVFCMLPPYNQSA